MLPAAYILNYNVKNGRGQTGAVLGFAAVDRSKNARKVRSFSGWRR